MNNVLNVLMDSHQPGKKTRFINIQYSVFAHEMKIGNGAKKSKIPVCGIAAYFDIKSMFSVKVFQLYLEAAS